MSAPFTAFSQVELDGLIEQVKEAADYGRALSAEDLPLLLNALLMLAQLQAEMADQGVTLQQLRKLAGLVQSSEELKHLAQDGEPKKPLRRQKPKPSPGRGGRSRALSALSGGLKKGQRCPECGRGTLYQYTPAVVLRISGQAPLKSTQPILERLRCNTCGAYFTAELAGAVQQDGPAEQTYGHSARALMAIQKYFAGAPFYRQQILQP